MTAAGSRSWTRLAPDARREQLVDVALALFAERDPHDVTLDAVAARAKVSRSLLYAYFGNRPGLVAAAHARRVDQLQAITVDGLRTARTNDEAVRVIVRIWFEEAARTPSLFRFFWSEAVRGDNVELVDWRRATAPVFARTYGRGPVAELLSSSIAGLLNAAVDEWLDTRAPSIDRVVDALATLILGGLSALDPVRWHPSAPWKHRP